MKEISKSDGNPIAIVSPDSAEILISGGIQVKENIMDIQPRADVIEYKFRTYNGQLQYRRWNATRNYWVDPYWIDLN